MRGLFYRFFADATALAVESRMTASGAERLSGILHSGFKLGTALRVTAIMPDFDSELGHSYSPDSPVVADLFFWTQECVACWARGGGTAPRSANLFRSN
jgi:hypothetical protein